MTTKYLLMRCMLILAGGAGVCLYMALVPNIKTYLHPLASLAVFVLVFALVHILRSTRGKKA